jgi:hypothetical protein
MRMETEREEEQQSQSGMPGDGRGRRDETGHSGVYPMSAPEGASPDAELQGEASWGQGDRGAAGYEDHGDFEAMTTPPERSQ